MYNYLESMVEDVKQAIAEKPEISIDGLLYYRENTSEKLYNDLWVDDSVTGNASGSYTFDSWTAAEYVKDNIDLLQDALQEFCVDTKTIAENIIDYEWQDVTIRCYLLGQAIEKAIDELIDELESTEK